MELSRIETSAIVTVLYLTTYIQLAVLAFTTNQQPSSSISLVRRQNRLTSSSTPSSHNQQLKAVDDNSSETKATDDNDNNATTLPFHICEAQYSDLAQAADLMTDGFYPQLQNNPILRPIRYFMELDRLQTNFPYDVDGRHYYLVAVATDDDTTNGGDKGRSSRKIIGFCDIDGRIPATDSPSLSPLVPNVRRPQPYFSDLVIHPEYRRRGIGMALMIEAEKRASNMGFEELYLGVKSTNQVALDMYSKIGYEFIIPQGDILAFLEVRTNRGVRMLRRSL